MLGELIKQIDFNGKITVISKINSTTNFSIVGKRTLGHDSCIIGLASLYFNEAKLKGGLWGRGHSDSRLMQSGEVGFSCG